MPGIIKDGSERIHMNHEPIDHNSSDIKENTIPKSPRDASASPLTPQGSALDLPVGNCVDTSIDRLYDNVCEMESSSNGTSSHPSFGSDGEESRIDLELRHLVGCEVKNNSEIVEEDAAEICNSNNEVKETEIRNGDLKSPSKSPDSSSKNSGKPSNSQLESETSMKSSPKNGVSIRKTVSGAAAMKKGGGIVEEDSPELGPFLLKHARDLIASDNHRMALKYALRAAKVFEKMSERNPSLDFAMTLHVIAAIHCSLGKFDKAIDALQISIEIPDLKLGRDHALAKFSGCMQLGDTYAMLGQLGKSIHFYTTGLNIQKQALGDNDPRVGETCRYLAEAHVQAMQLDEAEKLCKMALDIYNENGESSLLEETAARRLMSLICETKGNHEAALEHLLMASMSMAANGHETEVASVDCSIGDIYLSLGRYDEAVMAYQKALSAFKSSKGDNHPSVAAVLVRLADLYNKTGKFKESRSHCENALRIYGKPTQGTTSEEIASGLTAVSAIYGSMSEHEQALKLLQRALKMYNNAPGHQSTITGIEAQVGVLHYILGNYGSSYAYFKNTIEKWRACGEKSGFFGIALNQMGLSCVQNYALNEAVEYFEEAKTVLEQVYGPFHPSTLGAYSNLAGTYDAMGRLDEAIELLEHIVEIREVKLGTANPDVDDEKRRLAELLKESGRHRRRKAKSLEHLLDTNSHPLRNDAVPR